jgi:hypothetical protein
MSDDTRLPLVIHAEFDLGLDEQRGVKGAVLLDKVVALQLTDVSREIARLAAQVARLEKR